MKKFIKEIALKTEDFLNGAVIQCERNTNLIQAALNAEFALGKYFALMDIVKVYDVDLYVNVAESTTEAREKLASIVNKLYDNGGKQNG